MGLSFAVPVDVDMLAVTADWGRYGKARGPSRDGQHSAASGPGNRSTTARRSGWTANRHSGSPSPAETPDAPGVHLAVEVRPRDRPAGGELALVNAQAEPRRATRTPPGCSRPRLTVTALDGDAAVFLPIDDPLDDPAALSATTEERHLRLLYRDQLGTPPAATSPYTPTCATGERRAYRWRPPGCPPTTCPPPSRRVGADSQLAGVELSMDALAEADVDRARAGLAPLADGYAAGSTSRRPRIPDLPEPLRAAAATAVVQAARQSRDRIRAGIELLTDPTRRGTRGAGRVPVRQPGHGAAAPAHRDRPRSATQQGPELRRGAGRGRGRGREAAAVAAVPAGVRAAQPARADRPGAPGRGRRPRRRWSTCCSSRPAAARPRRTWA